MIYNQKKKKEKKIHSLGKIVTTKNSVMLDGRRQNKTKQKICVLLKTLDDSIFCG